MGQPIDGDCGIVCHSVELNILKGKKTKTTTTITTTKETNKRNKKKMLLQFRLIKVSNINLCPLK